MCIRDSHKGEVVQAVTKMNIPKSHVTVLLVVYNTTLIDDNDEDESLLTLMDIAENGITVDGIVPEHLQAGVPQRCGITVDGTFLPFEYNDEKLLFTIHKPTDGNLNDTLLSWLELTSMDNI